MVTQTTQKIYIPKEFETIVNKFMEIVPNDPEFINYANMEARDLMKRMCKNNNPAPSEDVIKMLRNSKTCMIRFIVYKYMRNKGAMQCQAQTNGQRN